MSRIRSHMMSARWGIACLLASAAPAAAQSIDYGQYEAIFGEPVTTSATGAPQRVSDVPAAMIIIRGEDLRRTGAINLAEALRGRAGIDVNRFGAQQYDVTVRGANQPFNPRLLVMVNGRQIYLDHYGLTSWSNLGIELAEIRQIEIVKGPVSALFGFNATAGAINIVTYNPVSDRVNAVSAQTGSDHARAVSAVGTLQLGDALGIRMSGGYARQDEFTDVGNLRPYRKNLALDAGLAVSSTVTARFGYSYADSKQLMEAPSFFQVLMGFRTHGAQAEVTAD
ncbi:MAG: tonB-dependent receptor, partial [Rhizorhabdus sp.]|nr:tonB-dependent receptor [Rhizorhabdus sp.]